MTVCSKNTNLSEYQNCHLSLKLFVFCKNIKQWCGSSFIVCGSGSGFIKFDECGSVPDNITDRDNSVEFGQGYRERKRIE